MVLVVYLFLSLFLGIILAKLENSKKDNFFDYIIISNIYILVFSGIFSNIRNDIFLVVLFQVIGNIFYITYVKEMYVINNNLYNILKYLFSIVTSYLLNVMFINRVDNVFLDIEKVKFIIWFGVIVYLYLNINNIFNVNKLSRKQKLYYQDSEYIVMQYAKFKNKYYNAVSSKYTDLNLLIYSIMIYENYNRTKLMRRIDELKYRLFSKKGKFGIMQVYSEKVISDIESIKLVIKKLERIYGRNKDILKTLNLYYKCDRVEVKTIYKEICNFLNK